MENLTESQKAVLDRVKTSPTPVVLHVGTARSLVAAGLIKSDGTKGHGRAMAAYVPA